MKFRVIFEECEFRARRGGVWWEPSRGLTGGGGMLGGLGEGCGRDVKMRGVVWEVERGRFVKIWN